MWRIGCSQGSLLFLFLLSMGLIACSTTKTQLKPKPKKTTPIQSRTRVPFATQRMLFSGSLQRGAFSRHGRPPQGTVDPTIAQQIVERALPLFQRCIQRSKHFFPQGLRQVRLTVLIGPRGRVWKSAFPADVTSVPRAKRCFEKIARRLLFPQPQGDYFAFWGQTLQLSGS